MARALCLALLLALVCSVHVATAAPADHVDKCATSYPCRSACQIGLDCWLECVCALRLLVPRAWARRLARASECPPKKRGGEREGERGGEGRQLLAFSVAVLCRSPFSSNVSGCAESRETAYAQPLKRTVRRGIRGERGRKREGERERDAISVGNATLLRAPLWPFPPSLSLFLFFFLLRRCRLFSHCRPLRALPPLMPHLRAEREENRENERENEKKTKTLMKRPLWRSTPSPPARAASPQKARAGGTGG